MKENNKKVTYEMYQRAMEKKSVRDRKQFKFLVIFMMLFFSQLIGGSLLAIFKKDYLNPFLIVSGIIWLMIIIPFVIKLLRCPECGRFFPKGRLHLIDTVQGAGEVWGTSGNFQYYDGTKYVYWTECKYCRNIIWVIKSRKKRLKK